MSIKSRAESREFKTKEPVVLPLVPMALSLFFILLSMVSIQFGAALAKELFPVLGAQGTTALRLILGATFQLIVWRPWKKQVRRSDFEGLLAYGIALGSMNLFFYQSLKTLPLGLAVGIEFTGPLGLAIWFSRKPLDLLWALLAAIGIVLILPLGSVGGADPANSLDPVGIAFSATAGLCWAFYIVLGQRLAHKMDSGAASSLGMLAAALVIGPVGLLTADRILPELSMLPLLLGMAIFSSALPYSLEMIALKKIPARTFGILMSLEPVFGAAIGLVLMGEMLTGRQSFAVGLIVTASLGSALGMRR